jgi:beta-phosphoglucomutase-like phosphatase (HAD superfamily)
VVATLLDFDGVLVDSEPAHLAAFNDVLAPKGIKIDEREYLEHFLSLDDAGVFRAALFRRGVTLREEEVRGLVAAKSPRFIARFSDAFRIFPGATDLVVRRAARGPVGIVSGALESEIVFALEKMGIRAQIAFIVSAEHAPVSKPDPAPFRVALREVLRLSPSEIAVAVEDSVGGVRAAKGAGLRCVGVAHSFGQAELLLAGADAVAENLASLTDALLDGAG